MILASFYFPCLTNHLKNNYSLSTSVSSLFFVMPIASYILILQFLDYLTSKFGLYSIYSFGLIVSTLSPLFLYPCPPIPRFIPCIVFGFLLNGIGQAPVFIPGLVALSNNIRKIDVNINELIANDISSAVNTLTIYIGEFVGPIIGGFLSFKYDFKYCCFFMFIIGATFTGIFIGCFLGQIKDEVAHLFKGKENDVQIYENETSFREGLINSQIMSKSLQINAETSWHFKFEVLSSRRNRTVKRRGTIKNTSLNHNFSHSLLSVI